jgi:dienelactone hydrolase
MGSVVRQWLATLLATLLFVPAAAAETVHFRSTTWPPTPLQLRLAKASGDTIAEQASVPLVGKLYRPTGTGRFPAVVLLHPCSGRLPTELEQADAARYTALGYVLLAVDSFGARGIVDGCAGGGASVDVVMDAYGALLHLASLPFVDPERVALVGYSYGAGVALSAVAFDGPERLFDRQFAAAVAYNPWCPEKLAVGVPTLILMGERDEWAPPRACEAMMARRSGLGASMRLIVYPHAHHAFNLRLAPRRHYGYHLEYDAAADQAAWRETTALLRQAFGR